MLTGDAKMIQFLAFGIIVGLFGLGSFAVWIVNRRDPSPLIRRRHTDMLDNVNTLSKGGTDEFRIASFDGCRLTIIGSSDLCYFHDIEITFTEVYFLRCPNTLQGATFFDVGVSAYGGRKFNIKTDDGVFEIAAESAVVAIARVYRVDQKA